MAWPYSNHDIAMLRAQYGSFAEADKTGTRDASSVALADINDSLSKPHPNQPDQQLLLMDWRTVLECGTWAAPSGHCTYSERLIDLRVIHQCASSWALQPEIHRLVKQFNEDGNETALIAFTHARAEFMRRLVRHLNLYWAVITSTAKTVIAESVRTDTTEFVLRPKSSFRDAHADKSIVLWTFQQNGHRSVIALSSERLTDAWMVSPSRRACGAVVFEPQEAPAIQVSAAGIGHAYVQTAALSSSTPPFCNFNLWRGYAIGPSVAASRSAETNPDQLRLAVKPFLDHIRTIYCRDNESLSIYVLHWMASLIQRPWVKLCVALVLQGEEGSGKGVIVNEFLAKIIGPQHSSHVTGLEPICGAFNGTALATACLVFVDEVTQGNALFEAKLKTLITEPRHTIVNKYVSSMSVRSYTNFILSSNKDHVVDMDAKGRRFCVMQTDNRFSGSQHNDARVAHFTQLLSVPVHLVARYLYQLDLSGFNPQDVPTTDMQRTQKRLSMEPRSVDLWLLQCIEARVLPKADDGSSARLQSGGMVPWTSCFASSSDPDSAWTARRSKSSVYEHYRVNAGSRPRPMETFWRQLQDIIPCRTIQQRASTLRPAAQLVEFPSLIVCRDAFRKHVADPQWPFEDHELELQKDGKQNTSVGVGYTLPSDVTRSHGEQPRRPFIPLDAVPDLMSWSYR